MTDRRVKNIAIAAIFNDSMELILNSKLGK